MNFQRLRSLVYENGSYRLVALIISLILWITVLGQKGAVTTKDVHLEFIVGEASVVTNEIPRIAEFRFTGARMALKKIAGEELAITMDLSKLDPGRQVLDVPKEALQLPLGVKIVSVTPSKLTVVLEEVIKKIVPVHVRWRKEKRGYKVAKVIPRKVEIRGAASSLRRIKSVSTEKIDFSTVRDSGEGILEVGAFLAEIDRPGVLAFEKKDVKVILSKKRKKRKKRK